MKFTCSRESISKLLSMLVGIVPTRAPKPVLQNILIEGGEDGALYFSATDLEIGIRCRFEVDDLQDAEPILLHAATLNGLIQSDWSKTITIETKEGKAKLITSSGSFTLAGGDSEEFPPIGKLDGDIIEINGDDFIDAAEKCLFATAKGDSRYALNGVYLAVKKNTIEFVGSDTHRLSLVKKKVKNTKDVGVSSIVITKGIQELAKLAQDEEKIAFTITKHEMIAETSKATLVIRLVDGQFPRYNEVVPKNTGIKVTTAREELVKVLKQIGHITSEDTHSISFNADGESLIISASATETGSGSVTLKAKTEGGKIETSFNNIYILDLLKVLHQKEVTFQFNEAAQPSRVDSGDFTHVIMPIKTTV